MAGQCWEAGRHFSEHCGEQRWVLKSPAYQLHIQHTCLSTRQLILHSLWRHRRPRNLKSTDELNILLDTLQVVSGQSSQPIVTGAKHLGSLSTNLLADIDKTEHNYKQEQHNKPKQPCKKTTSVCTNYSKWFSTTYLPGQGRRNAADARLHCLLLSWISLRVVNCAASVTFSGKNRDHVTPCTAQKPSTLASWPSTSDVHTMFACLFTSSDQATHWHACFTLERRVSAVFSTKRPWCSMHMTTSWKAFLFCCWSSCLEQLVDPCPHIRDTDSVQESPQDSLVCCILH